MMRTHSLIAGMMVFLMVLGLALLPAEAAKKGTAKASGKPMGAVAIQSVRYGSKAEETRIVIDFNRAPGYRAFLLTKPERLVVDVSATQWKTFSSMGVPHGVVRGYRSGTLSDGLIRIIFDLTKPAVVTRSFIAPKGVDGKDRLVVDMIPSTKALFEARTQEVYGNRALKGGGAQASSSKTRTGGVSLTQRTINDISLPPPRAYETPDELTPEKPTTAKNTAKGRGQKIYTVVIDAGHGGEDPGAISTAAGLKEKHITLALAKALKRELDETGRYRAILTRSEDRYIKLRERLAFSRKVNADLFISIHADKVGRSNTRGASVYTLSEKASDEESARLAEDENNSGVIAGVDLREESQDVADILLDLAMREKMNESNLFARYVVEAFRRKNVRLLPNSHRSAGFAVLKAPDVPAILIESGFLSNADEANLLNSNVFQAKFAAAVTDGIDAYFRKIQALQKS